MLSKSSLNPEAGIFMLQTYKLISHCKNVLIVIALILINKHVFEPSYNDLKIYSLKLQLLFQEPNK